MSKERGLVRQVWKTFIASLMPRTARRKLVGEDYYGTKYYQDPEANGVRGRSFVPVNKDNFQQELPAEWEAWLRYRRQQPPSDEECKANYNAMIEKKKNAAELDVKYAIEKGTSIEMPKEKRGFESFPTYDEYKDQGRNYYLEKQNKQKNDD